ncbi:MAG: hypothetical protein WC807_00525 [Hyphomicrobium sp.]|jgi:surface antigen
MRDVPIEDTSVVVAVAGMMLALLVLLGPSKGHAAEELLTTGPACSCPPTARGPGLAGATSAGTASRLDENDEIAALSSLQIGLSRMDDGTPFVWRRGNGRLSGIVRPTRSFRSASGSLCRHVVVLLTTGYRTRTAEGVACRLEGGRWQLEG